ncbi:Sir2 family NAD+-dependent deacetylase [Parendozoicomonas haliclonae]|uniref:NAD-dependent protein deacylase n=1 Tax=Parendozoicomonas haliclonae TaxID=1960125 RepID=A0A1X7ADS6_9GAMM|nr:Sir2 family NAD+-dependent deacetylase [Parendozoicomonas haliclonae]SMA32036.1 NAD-dependent protein deacylase [Parendozoicomonas haliclonae]
MSFYFTNINSIVVLTGAGISAESGLSTFRLKDGLWDNHPVDEVATPEGFQRNPALVHEFYNARRQQLSSVEPNAAHLALSAFEKSFSGNILLVTQNVDDLHDRAGSHNLVHMHGELLKCRCTACGTIKEIRSDLSTDSLCEDCGRKGTLRPDIVWFGEMPMELDRIYDALAQCDLFVSIGTSGNVYPAAGFFQEAKMAGAHTVELNLDPGEHASGFDQCLYGPATQLVPEFFGAS